MQLIEHKMKPKCWRSMYMNESAAIRDRYQAAVRVYVETCAKDPSMWHRPDIVEFNHLRRLLLPHAESGDVMCQYALATILNMAGLLARP